MPLIDLPRVHVIVLGGTITMMPQADGGVAPKLSGEDLVKAAPQIPSVCEITVSTPFLVPGASLTFEHIAEVARIIESTSPAVDGIVVVQGTDTIDEVAFALDILLDIPTPVVVTGAMRNPSMAGADGPANLVAAAIVASSANSRGLGVTVVLNDEVHVAHFVEKGHSALPSAFSSPGAGPIGEVVEGEFRLLWRHQDLERDFSHIVKGFADVALVGVGLGDNGKMLNLVAEADFAGAVVEAMGGGHLPELTLASIDVLAAKMPVVLAKRMPGGAVLRNTYGFKGSERYLLSRGLIPAGRLSATKARLLLAAMVHANASREEIRTAFEAFN